MLFLIIVNGPGPVCLEYFLLGPCYPGLHGADPGMETPLGRKGGSAGCRVSPPLNSISAAPWCERGSYQCSVHISPKDFLVNTLQCFT